MEAYNEQSLLQRSFLTATLNKNELIRNDSLQWMAGALRYGTVIALEDGYVSLSKSLGLGPNGEESYLGMALSKGMGEKALKRVKKSLALWNTHYIIRVCNESNY